MKSMRKNSPITGKHDFLTIEQMRKTVLPLFKRTGIEKAILFGSFAKGTASRRSDIDILIIQQTDKRFLDRFEEFSGIYTLLKDYAVDLLVYSPEELERNAHRQFIKTILSEAVILYER
jgi:predicted nucleotidyltransferase